MLPPSSSRKTQQPRRRRPASPPGTAPAEEKPLPEYLSLLPRSDCRETGATGGNQIKTYRIQLTAEEQKKLEQVLKRLKQRDLQSYFLSVLKEQWLKLD